MVSEEDQRGRVYELTGDHAYTLADLAAEVSRQSGRDIKYRNLSEAEYNAALVAGGLPPDLAALFSSSHAAVAERALFDESRDLSRLIGRPTTTMATSVSNALQDLDHYCPDCM